MKRIGLVVLCFFGGVVAIFASWQWYCTPVVTLSPEYWQEDSPLQWHGDSEQIGLYFWSKRRHTPRLHVSQYYVLEASGESVPVRLTSISYPTLYPNDIRIGFELVNPEDIDILLRKHDFLVRGAIL